MPNYLLTLTIYINSSRLEKYNWTYNSYKKKIIHLWTENNIQKLQHAYEKL